MNIVIRKRTTQDDSFIYSSWIRSKAKAFAVRETAEWYRDQRGYVGRALERGHTIVAAPAEEESTILGWLNHHLAVLKYVYVRENVRLEGICRRLCREAFGDNFFCVYDPTPRFVQISKKLGCTLDPQQEAHNGKAATDA